MKRKIVHLIGVVLLLSLLFTGCNAFAETQPKVPEETPVAPPEETPSESPADEPELPSDVKSATPYGEFNGVYVVDISNALNIAVAGFERLEGYYFPTLSSDFLDVYNSNDGKYYSLTEAFKNGLLTADNIKVVNEKYVSLHSKYYEQDYVGKGSLSIGVGEDHNTYVDAVFTTTGISESNKLTVIEVGGYSFKVLEDESLTVTRDRTEYTLAEAYEAKIISDKDVADIYEIWTYAKY